MKLAREKYINKGYLAVILFKWIRDGEPMAHMWQIIFGMALIQVLNQNILKFQKMQKLKLTEFDQFLYRLKKLNCNLMNPAQYWLKIFSD